MLFLAVRKQINHCCLLKALLVVDSVPAGIIPQEFVITVIPVEVVQDIIGDKGLEKFNKADVGFLLNFPFHLKWCSSM